MGDQNIGNLEEEARKRKERLKALREQRKGNEPAAKKEKVDLPKPELKLRNYEPVTEDLKTTQLSNAKPGIVEDHIKEQTESGLPQPTITDDVDLLNLAPRKPDWDLKRDIKAKLERLERRTQRAITELIRERLKESAKKDPSNIAAAPDVSQEGYESD
ncbi:coiled-coil domain-containing protein 12-like isoform X2 [Clavelina lepadiformis]|uniref:Coiled-coil domain-containing protein 12 n=1 Tax=Clavelina lepadiformis TaxID=159417 RepID=A0ABP0H0T5_CLALP